jgi:hypothetical protein
MAFFAIFQVGADKDRIWTIQLNNVTVESLRQLLESPEAEINRIRDAQKPGAEEVKFEPTIPIDFQVTYDLEEGDTWGVLGIYKTNRISLHAPKSRLTLGRSLGAVGADPIVLDDPTLDVTLIFDDDIPHTQFGIGHFNPRVGSDPFVLNCAKMIYDPNVLLEALEERINNDELTLAVNNLEDNATQILEGHPTLLRHTISPQLRMQIQKIPMTSPCFPLNAQGNCVKYLGAYDTELEGNTTFANFRITEVFRIPYCEPAIPDEG